MNISTVTQKGQVTIPVAMRRKLGLKTNGRVRFELKKQKIVLEPVLDLLDVAGTFKVGKNKGVDPVKAREYMEKHYKRV